MESVQARAGVRRPRQRQQQGPRRAQQPQQNRPLVAKQEKNKNQNKVETDANNSPLPAPVPYNLEVSGFSHAQQGYTPQPGENGGVPAFPVPPVAADFVQGFPEIPQNPEQLALLLQLQEQQLQLRQQQQEEQFQKELHRVQQEQELRQEEQEQQLQLQFHHQQQQQEDQVKHEIHQQQFHRQQQQQHEQQPQLLQEQEQEHLQRLNQQHPEAVQPPPGELQHGWVGFGDPTAGIDAGHRQLFPSEEPQAAQQPEVYDFTSLLAQALPVDAIVDHGYPLTPQALACSSPSQAAAVGMQGALSLTGQVPYPHAQEFPGANPFATPAQLLLQPSYAPPMSQSHDASAGFTPYAMGDLPKQGLGLQSDLEAMDLSEDPVVDQSGPPVADHSGPPVVAQSLQMPKQEDQRDGTPTSLPLRARGEPSHLESPGPQDVASPPQQVAVFSPFFNRGQQSPHLFPFQFNGNIDIDILNGPTPNSFPDAAAGGPGQINHGHPGENSDAAVSGYPVNGREILAVVNVEDALPPIAMNIEPGEEDSESPQHIADDVEYIDRDPSAPAAQPHPEPVVARGSRDSRRPSTGEANASQALVERPRVPQPGRRRNLTWEERRDATQARREGVCIRCKFQKQKCLFLDNGPNAECVACSNVNLNSRKTIHRLPCLRIKLASITLFRDGGLKLTARWEGVQVRNVASRVDGVAAREILVTQGICSVPLKFKVAKYEPGPGDVCARYWTDFRGKKEVRKKKDLGPWCFDDVYQAVVDLETYTVKNALLAFQERVYKNARRGKPMDVVERTYEIALEHYHSMNNPDGGMVLDDKRDTERILLENFFVLWFGIQHTTGSFWILGDETLDMEPEVEDKSYPLFNRVSVPRMIVAQFDSINHKAILTKYKKRVMKGLEDIMMKGNHSQRWLSIYLVIFILLNEASWICEDRYRHARANYGQKVRFSIPTFVEALQEGCNHLLSHWHYCNWRGWPSSRTPGDRHLAHFGDIGIKCYELLLETKTDHMIRKHLTVWNYLKKNNFRLNNLNDYDPKDDEEAPRVLYDWTSPGYWIAQLFEDDWSPHPIYRSEPIPNQP